MDGIKVRVTKASDWNYDDEIEFDSAEEFLEYIKEAGEVILEHCTESLWNLKIYDSYVE